EWRVLNIKGVIRPDLAEGFLSYRDSLRQLLEDPEIPTSELLSKMAPNSQLAENDFLDSASREDLINDLVRPRLAFHGTVPGNIPSIIRCEFKKAGSTLENGR